MKVAIVGCGQIADAHIQEVRKVDGAQVVALCDTNRHMVDQAALRFDIPAKYTDLIELMADQTPDVVHVTSPPASHLEIGRIILETGAHIYMEKPFTVNAREAQELVDLAEEKGLLVCAGHSQAFDSPMVRLRELFAAGDLGQMVHMDALMSYNLDGQFGSVLMKDPTHWVHRLPGGVIQNNLSHPLSFVLDFLEDPSPRVLAKGFRTTDRIYGDVRDRLVEELRVQILGRTTTASISFSCSVRPVQLVASFFGTKQQAVMSSDARTLRLCGGASLPGPFHKIQWSRRDAREAGRAWRANVVKLFAAKLHFFEGLNELIRRFYQAVEGEGPMPVPMSEAVRLTAIMDEIFDQVRRDSAASCV